LLFFCGTGLAARAESAGAGEPDRPAAEAVESTLPRRPLSASDPVGERLDAVADTTEPLRLGPRTLTLEPRLELGCLEGLSNLLSLNREAFMRRGLGVLKMDGVSRKRALEKRRSTTQMMTNMRPRPTSAPIMAGSTGWPLPLFLTQLMPTLGCMRMK